MRRNQSKFKIYTGLVLNSSRSPNTSIVTQSMNMIKLPAATSYANFSNLPKNSQQSVKDLVKSVKLPKINFSLAHQTVPEYVPPPVSLSKKTEFSASPKLLSIYESISNLEKSILAPKPIDFDALPQQDLSVTAKKFFLAIRINNEEKVMKMLKSRKGLVNIRDSVGKTPLHWAVIRNHLEIAQVLISFGADLKAVDYFNRTAKHFAQATNNEEALNLLSKHN